MFCSSERLVERRIVSRRKWGPAIWIGDAMNPSEQPAHADDVSDGTNGTRDLEVTPSASFRAKKDVVVPH